MRVNEYSAANMESSASMIERILVNMEKVIIGKKDRIRDMLIALLCGGHVLLEDVPGVGKTMMVRALAKTLDLSFQRIQCTPDLLPSDVTGLSIYNQKTQQFEFQAGPIMAQIVLVDEINRTPARTQSAMLEAMEEKKITVDGATYDLPDPFLLLATQNPLDFEGTYPLPEAQMDRFLMKIKLGYPQLHEEVEMLDRLQVLHPISQLQKVTTAAEWLSLQQKVLHVHIDRSLKQYIVELTAATRNHADVRVGASPRASLALMKTAQAAAFTSGRDFVLPDDIKRMIHPTLSHRISLLNDTHLTGMASEQILERIAALVPVPVNNDGRIPSRRRDRHGEGA